MSKTSETAIQGSGEVRYGGPTHRVTRAVRREYTPTTVVTFYYTACGYQAQWGVRLSDPMPIECKRCIAKEAAVLTT